jgi:hypothetical protein
MYAQHPRFRIDNAVSRGNRCLSSCVNGPASAARTQADIPLKSNQE